MPYYVVKHVGDQPDRLVVAKNQGAVARHIMTDYQVKPATNSDIATMLLGGFTLENAAFSVDGSADKEEQKC